MIDHTARIYIAGHTGVPGTALVTALQKQGYSHIITRTHTELNLEDFTAVTHFFNTEKPEYVFIAAAKVPKSNNAQNIIVDVLETNFRIVSNLLRAALNTGTEKVLLIGSLYAYPTQCTQPVTENQLLTGPLDTTLHAYALAKNLCMALCTAYNVQYHVPFITCIPSIIYGTQDMLDPYNSKSIIQIIRTLADAHHSQSPSAVIKDVPTHIRDYLYVDDFAQACIYLMQYYNDPSPINIGSGIGISTHDLVTYCAKKIGYTGSITYDHRAYNMPTHVLDIRHITQLGWKALTSLNDGINNLLTYV